MIEELAGGGPHEFRIHDARVRIAALPRDARDLHRRRDRLVRGFLAEILAVGADEIAFRRDAFGRPALDPIPHCPQSSSLDFSISHPDGVLAVAASCAAKVGIDVERYDDRFDLTPVLETFFTPSEQRWISSLHGGARWRAFSRLDRERGVREGNRARPGVRP